MKKYILNLGTAVVGITPVIAAVSCGGFTSSSEMSSRFQDVNIKWHVEGDDVTSVIVETNKELTNAELRDYVWTAMKALMETPFQEDFVIAAMKQFEENFENEMNDVIVVPVDLEHIDMPQTLIHAPERSEVNQETQSTDISTILGKETRSDWSSLDSSIKSYLIQNNNNVMPNLTATVHKTKYMNFAIDNDLHIPEYEATNLIKKFYDETNWGLGLTTMDTVLITNKKMGSAGWGGAAKDLLVACEPMVNSEIDNYSLQNMYDTLRHEYGHHETLTSTSLVGGEDVRTANLINNKMPNYQVLDTVTNHPENIEQLKTAMMANINPSGADTPVSEIYTAPMFDAMVPGYSVSKDFSFNLSYHYNKSGEVLNRPMNVLEASAYTENKYLTGSPIMMADNMGFYFSDANHSQKLLDPTTGQYDQTNTNKLIQLWKDYVYGYDKNKLSVDYFNVAGYSNSDIDFAVIKNPTATGISEVTVKLKKAPTHFISGRTSFDTDPTWDTDALAYGGVIQPVGNYYRYSPEDKNETNKPHFYKDSNANGQLDQMDTEVTDVAYDWNV